MNPLADLRPIQRCRQLGRIVAAEGWRGVRQRARRSLSEWIAPSVPLLSVRSADVVAADLLRPRPRVAPRPRPGEALSIDWVTVPAGPGAGGHTTLFRLINHLQARGCRNRVYFYDTCHVDLDHYAGILRRHYQFEGEIASVDAGLLDAHAVVATSWQTAYPVFNSGCQGKRFFLVQDFEPWFYSAGATQVLAENTYRMGFHAITAGRWLARKLKSEFGMEADHFEFGCDTRRYRRLDTPDRNGVAFYARPEVTRRGFELGVMALELLAQRRPQATIHLYGDRIHGLPFAFVNHGRIGPDQLNAVYNTCRVGLSLSLSNVSLVPHEMLAAGCIPVVNDAPHNRVVLDNPYVDYAPTSPHALADALEARLTMDGFDAHSQAAARSVLARSWDDAGACVEAILRRTLRGDSGPGDAPGAQPGTAARPRADCREAS